MCQLALQWLSLLPQERTEGSLYWRALNFVLVNLTHGQRITHLFKINHGHFTQKHTCTSARILNTNRNIFILWKKLNKNHAFGSLPSHLWESWPNSWRYVYISAYLKLPDPFLWRLILVLKNTKCRDYSIPHSEIEVVVKHQNITA